MRQCVQSSRPSAQHIAGDHMGLPLPIMLSPSPVTWFPCREAQSVRRALPAVFLELVEPLSGQRMGRVWGSHLTRASST